MQLPPSVPQYYSAPHYTAQHSVVEPQNPPALQFSWCSLSVVLHSRRYARLASGDAAEIRDGRTSYPSGHAAETFMAFGLLSFYLLAKMKLFTKQTNVRHGVQTNSYCTLAAEPALLPPQLSGLLGIVPAS